MSFPVENIRALCKKRGTSLAALERSLGFGNGVIAGWETAKIYPPYDRVSAVAAALGVSIEELTGEKAPASVSESGRPYVDLDTKMIWAPTPVSILAAQYVVSSVSCIAMHWASSLGNSKDWIHVIALLGAMPCSMARISLCSCFILLTQACGSPFGGMVP